jgi:hypothetical protein
LKQSGALKLQPPIMPPFVRQASAGPPRHWADPARKPGRHDQLGAPPQIIDDEKTVWCSEAGGTMSINARELRQLELRALRRTDPVALLAIYRQGAGDLDQLAQRPFGVSFQEMIAAILEREESDGRPTMRLG